MCYLRYNQIYCLVFLFWRSQQEHKPPLRYRLQCPVQKQLYSECNLCSTYSLAHDIGFLCFGFAENFLFSCWQSDSILIPIAAAMKWPHVRCEIWCPQTYYPERLGSITANKRACAVYVIAWILLRSLSQHPAPQFFFPLRKIRTVEPEMLSHLLLIWL